MAPRCNKVSCFQGKNLNFFLGLLAVPINVLKVTFKTFLYSRVSSNTAPVIYEQFVPYSATTVVLTMRMVLLLSGAPPDASSSASPIDMQLSLLWVFAPLDVALSSHCGSCLILSLWWGCLSIDLVDCQPAFCQALKYNDGIDDVKYIFML